MLRIPCLIAFACLALSACSKEPDRSFTILSGSENRPIEPIVQAYCEDEGWDCQITYNGSVDIKLALERSEFPYDAVWPAHRRWIELGDRQRRVKHVESIATSPVVFAVRRSLAEELDLIGRDVTTREILELVETGELSYIATSATQSNSGFSFYLASLQSLAGDPEVLTVEMLENEVTQADVKTLLAGIARTSGSSNWLKDLYLDTAHTERFDAMVNYEMLIIDANRQLESQGLEPLYAIYPSDGVAIADSPLGYVAHEEDEDSEAFFVGLQDYLLSEDVQDRLLELGRRTGFGGIAENADPETFRIEWGIDAASMPKEIRFPTTETIQAALALYQEALRKPSLVAFCLDFSGSMKGEGEAALKEALATLFDPETAKRWMLQPTPDDLFLVLPFSDRLWGHDFLASRGQDALQAIPRHVRMLSPGGGTNMYACAGEMLRQMVELPELATHQASIVMLTDGRSEDYYEDYENAVHETGRELPIFGITFGNAERQQLEELAAQTHARVFDGTSDLAQAFRHVRGYQ